MDRPASGAATITHATSGARTSITIRVVMPASPSVYTLRLSSRVTQRPVIAAPIARDRLHRANDQRGARDATAKLFAHQQRHEVGRGQPSRHPQRRDGRKGREPSSA